MSNIYHEGCPLYRTSTEHICNLLSFPIAMRIISRLLAKQPRSKDLWLLVLKYGWINRILQYDGARCHPLVKHLTSLVVERQLPECGVGLVYIPLVSLARTFYMMCIKTKRLNWALPCRDTAPSSSLTSSCPWWWYSYLFLLNTSPKNGRCNNKVYFPKTVHI